MLDLSPFNDQNFDTKRWINSACQNHHQHESMDNLLTGLELKLQVASEETALSIEEHSTSALLRVPRATQDIFRMEDDAVSLRNSVSRILHKLKKAEGSSAESVSAIVRIDAIKRRMESAYDTLQDAAGLTQLSSTVEDVFSGGNLLEAAETLAKMRHCLCAVGDVAEFANIRQQLEVLEDRLENMVHPLLTVALSNRQVDVIQELRGILIKIGRYKSLETVYTKYHMKFVKGIWEDFDIKEKDNKLNFVKNDPKSVPNDAVTLDASFANCLPNFYEKLLLYLEQERKWCLAAFPDEYGTLVPKLLIDMMHAVATDFSAHFSFDDVLETKTAANGARDSVSVEPQKGIQVTAKHLEDLIHLLNVTGNFTKNIQLLFSGSDRSIMMDLLRAIYLPYEFLKHRYKQMEHAVLSSEVAAMDLRGATSRGVGAQGVELSEAVRRMEESVPQVITASEAAMERCILLTGGSEAAELTLTLDDVMLQYISSLQGALKSLRTACRVDTVRKDGTKSSSKPEFLSNEEEWSIVHGALQVLAVADGLTKQFSALEASLRATLAGLNTSLPHFERGSGFDQWPLPAPRLEIEERFASGRASLDMATIWLMDAPEKARKLLTLLDQARDSRFHILPHAYQRIAAFVESVSEFVYDVLISKVQHLLHGLSHSPAWSSMEEQKASSLPSFNAYPQSYVTGIGEYLLTLPQQLEPFSECSGASVEDGQFATEWMFKVTEGATSLFIEQLRGIQSLTDRGAQQLAVDIEYLNNVLSALTVPIPKFLSTFYTCVSTPREQLRGILRTDMAKELDVSTVNFVCRIRHVNTD